MKSKYHNKITIVDNIKFASIREAERYKYLKPLSAAGLIKDLRLQPRFVLIVEKIKICTYVADFEYWLDDQHIVEDVKGMKTPVYRLKKKLLLAVYGIDVAEI